MKFNVSGFPPWLVEQITKHAEELEENRSEYLRYACLARLSSDPPLSACSDKQLLAEVARRLEDT